VHTYIVPLRESPPMCYQLIKHWLNNGRRRSWSLYHRFQMRANHWEATKLRWQFIIE